jgi:hypothetical protein
MNDHAFGIVAAELPLGIAIARIAAHTSPFLGAEPVAGAGAVPPGHCLAPPPSPAGRAIVPRDLWTSGEGWPFVAGERGGRSYVLEPFLLLARNHDLLARVAIETRGLVAWCGAGAQGEVSFFAVRKNKLLRAWWGSSEVERFFDRGAPLRSEREAPLSTGEGLVRALESLGFDPRSWLASGPCRKIVWTETEPRFGAKDLSRPGPIEAALRAHTEGYRRAATPSHCA